MSVRRPELTLADSVKLLANDRNVGAGLIHTLDQIEAVV